VSSHGLGILLWFRLSSVLAMKERYPNGTWVCRLQRLAMPLGVFMTVCELDAIGLCDSDGGVRKDTFLMYGYFLIIWKASEYYC
jgi:hypothetical protein